MSDDKKYRLVDLSVEEVSFVHDPANPEARILITKKKASMDEMKCPDCGAMNKKGATECAKCGYKMTKAAVKENDMADLEKDLAAAEQLASEEQTKRIAAEGELAKAKAEIDALKKAAETPEVIEKRKLEALPAEFRKRLEDAEAEIAKSKDRDADQVAVAKCKSDFSSLKGKVEDNAKLYRKATKSMDTDEVKAFDELLKSASEAMKSNLFTEKGSAAPAEGSAGAQMEALIKAEVAKGTPYMDAVKKVAAERKDLAEQYSEDRRNAAKPVAQAS